MVCGAARDVRQLGEDVKETADAFEQGVQAVKESVRKVLAVPTPSTKTEVRHYRNLLNGVASAASSMGVLVERSAETQKRSATATARLWQQGEYLRNVKSKVEELKGGEFNPDEWGAPEEEPMQ